ncbi:sugar phosphate isomerase/epimerase [Paracoccus aurantiacus]|uniref:Sugar phosphate isomerase/epimerase n=1 Tax=Paracoccus aurantiacus TaxID=2599412 RepID=A0A5C6RPA6_9RHOB|nr:TIM barrel protein [Paracoccus aurantiacus]TXB64053.1 sugar phosphate isomerase/epimerase [Paracoccus aurantiacus]
MRSLGLGHFTFLNLSPTELVRLARAAGFGFVGLRFHPVAPGQLHWLPDAAGLAELTRVMDGEGVDLYDIETVVIDAELDPKALIPAMDAAAALGASRVNTCADDFPDLVPRFAQICALADERELGVDIECMAWRGIASPAACLDLIDRSGAANAGYLVDALHHMRCGGTPADIAAMPPGSIRSAQLCDASFVAPGDAAAMIAEARGGRLLPGDGGLPLRDIVAALPPDAVLSVELPSAADRRSALERARAIYAATAALFQREAI